MAENLTNQPLQQQRTCLCTSFPDFAAVCLFIDRFGKQLGLHSLDISKLKEGFEDNSAEVSDLIQGLHLYLLRRIKKNVPGDRWERELVKFCMSYNQWNAWELEERGYGKLKVQTRLCIIRNLLEAQFDSNLKFQERLRAELPEEDLRQQCYGRDSAGLCYWLVQDEKLSVNIYQEEQDDTDGASWRIVAKDREEMEVLIGCLKENKPIPCVLAQNSERCDTPLSVLSLATGAAAFNLSRAATPTKFALDRSTPVKAQLSGVPTVKTELSEDEADSVKKASLTGESDVKQETKDDIQNSNDEKLSADMKEEQVAEQKSADGMVNSPFKGALKDETTDCVVNTSKQASDNEEIAHDARIPFTYSATDLSLMSVASDQTPTAKGASDQCFETDSEDNLPLSQLKKSLVLMNQTRCSLMKAKKKHEKKKWKEMMKKKQKRRKKGQKQEAAVDSPKSSHRSSGRQRKPVFQDLQIEDDSSDSSLSGAEYPMKKGRNAMRQAKRSGVVHLMTNEDLSSEVDNDDTPCTSCKKYNQPHLMLLCDKCDAGWHTGCVKPPLFYIPDGEWHCPNCEHLLLIEKLEADLERIDGLIKEKEARMKKLERQEKYALSNGINPSNIITEFNSADRPARERKSKKLDEYAYDSEDDYEEVTMKRSCRKRTKVNYTFEQYEAVMNNAISKDDCDDDPTILAGTNSSLVSASKVTKSSGQSRPPPGQSRGKDISNLLDGTKFSIMSDEEVDEELDSSREEVIQREKENISVTSKGSIGARKRKRPSKFNDMDADSAAEDDEDYKMSDEANEDEGPSVGSDENVSDDIWTPGGIRKGGRKYTPREKVRDFICDEEESEPEQRKKKTYQRPRRTATATQAALRKKREAKFGFTSSEESLATTPCSSSTEEEEHRAKRRVNKWNKMKTYSAGTKKGKKESRKKKRLKKNFASDESTEESSDSEDEYLPLVEQDIVSTAGQDVASAAEAETDAEDPDGVHRVNNRLESSSGDDDTDDSEGRSANQTRSKVKVTPIIQQDRATPIMQNDPTPILQNDPASILQNDPKPVRPKNRTISVKQNNLVTPIMQNDFHSDSQTDEFQKSTAVKKQTELQTPSSPKTSSVNGDVNISGGKHQTNLQTPKLKAHESETIEKANVGSAHAQSLQDSTATEAQITHSASTAIVQTNNQASTVTAGSKSSGEKIQTSSVSTTEAASAHSNLVPEVEAVKSQLPVPSRPSNATQKSKLHGSKSLAQDNLPRIGNANNSNNHGMSSSGSPSVVHPLASGSVKPASFQPGFSHPSSFNTFPTTVPGHSTSNDLKRPSESRHQLVPPTSTMQGMNGQPYFHQMPLLHTQFPAQSYPQHYPSLYQLPYSHPAATGQGHCVTATVNPPFTSNSQTSNAFMVDNLLDSGPSVDRYDVPVGSMAEDDDEMSSYMTLANSIASGGTDKQ
ncbi:enolase-phosphatase E1-like [Watersipora subatra]|uniref:enolase-phosphatase E1-like n=1 Tax=Watersipora subatra TaxID=2589382 RepID=UPI00355BC308